MIIRPYRDGDAWFLVRVFFSSVRDLACAKYDVEQIRAWAPDVPDPMEWEKRMRSHETFVAERDGKSVAFIEMERNGHLRMLYRVPGVAGSGVADALYRAVEERAHELRIRRMHTEASLLAESFFISHGYTLDQREVVERNGVSLPRARMSKMLLPRG